MKNQSKKNNKLTHADNDIYGIIEMYPWPVRFSFLQSAVMYTDEQLNISISKLKDANMIELVDHHARTYQVKTA
jgi:hypothetical protein